MEREHPFLAGRRIVGVADPAIFDASRGESVAETGERYGIYFEPGDNRRIAGWMQLHERLIFDRAGVPMLYIFRTCTEFLRTVPTLQYSRTSPEDVDSDMEDHIADETRYLCMMVPLPHAQAAEPEEVIFYDPLDRPIRTYRNAMEQRQSGNGKENL